MFEQQQTAIKRLNDAIEEGYASGFVDVIDWDALDRRADQAAVDELGQSNMLGAPMRT
jgi:uncharacterized protein YoaH (UPF0181 family)